MATVNIKELAQRLGLSPSTVSKALKDSYEISQKTKQRVIELAQKLHYTPNPYASGLRRKNSKTIAIVVPEVEDSFFSKAINGIESVAHSLGYHVLIYLTHENSAIEDSILKDLANGRVDGIVISVTSETKSPQYLMEYSQSGRPLVFFDRVVDEIPVHKVLTDDFQAGYLACKHLIDNQCKNILFLSIGDNLNIMKRRNLGSSQCVKEDQGKSHIRYKSIDCTADPDQAYKIIRKQFQSKYRPDGVIGAVEKLAISTYLVCQDLKIIIPDEIKVIAFSNLPIAELLNPGLTTIRQPAYEIGKTAAELLFDGLLRMRSPYTPKSVTLPSILESRASSAG